MKITDFVSVLAALVVAASSTPISSTSSHTVHERRSVVPAKWAKHSRLHPAFVIPVRIGLAQSNLHKAEEYINEVAHPGSKYYGQHWTPERVAETFAPKQETVDAIQEWLKEAGISLERVQLTKGGTWMTFKVTAAEAEQLLKTEYHLYHHENGHKHVACDHYSIPSHLTKHVDFITPTVHFDKRIGTPRKQEHRDLPPALHEINKRELDRRTLERRGSDVEGKSLLQMSDLAGVSLHSTIKTGSPEDTSNPKQGLKINDALMTLDNCDTMITTPCLQALYAMPPGTKAAKNNTMGVVEYTPQAFLQSDLNMWNRQFATGLEGKGPSVKLIDGAIVQTTNQSFNFNGESALDLEFAMGLIMPQGVTLYQVGDTVAGGSFNNFLDALDASYCDFDGGGSKDPNVDGQYPDTKPGGYTGDLNCGTMQATKVISTSYSSNEADLSPKYETRQCLEYMKLGLQGVSILYSSGDFGVAGNGGECIDPVTGAYNNGTEGIFNPSFPGTCPYITSVGATQIMNGSTVHTPESASQRVIFSGGGFSNVFAMPSYQKAAQSAYFANNLPPYGPERYNNSQKVRGYPDVSANGVNYVTAVNGQFSLAFGTSASAPTFASLLNLINEERIAKGKTSVGFVNPALYEHPEVMNDVTTGGNEGCGTSGYQSVEGWDPVTGLGTPNYPSMLDMFMKLP